MFSSRKMFKEVEIPYTSIALLTNGTSINMEFTTN
jgi:hypothetical protein